MRDNEDREMQELVYRLVAMAPEAPPFPEEPMVKVMPFVPAGSKRRFGLLPVAALAAVMVVGFVVSIIVFGDDPSGPSATQPPQTSTSQPPPTSTTSLAPPTRSGVTYEYLEGLVTFVAESSWHNSLLMNGPTKQTLLLDDASQQFVMMTDPTSVGAGCEPGPTPADAEALAQSLLSDTDLVVTTPVTVRVGGVDALQMDIVAAPGASSCDEPVVSPLILIGRTGVQEDGLGAWDWLDGENPMRLYLLDLPGEPARILAIAIVAPANRLAEVLDAAAPILDSLEFHAG